MTTSNLISIRQFLPGIPHIPSLNSQVAGWQDITLLRFSLPSGGEVDVPGLAENVLCVGLRPKIQYEILTEQRAKPQVLHQGDAAITPAGHAQHWRWLSPFDAVNLFIPSLLIAEMGKDLVKGDLSSVGLMGQTVTSVPFLSAVTAELLSELESDFPCSNTYVDTLTHSLVIYLVKYHSTAKVREATALLKPDNGYVSCAIDFIQAHLNDDLRLAAIASACNISVNHLCAVFKQSTGQSVHQFVIQQRLERAKVLLKSSKKSLVGIAQETGFSNQAHFTNSFRKACGITPSQYRLD